MIIEISLISISKRSKTGSSKILSKSRSSECLLNDETRDKDGDHPTNKRHSHNNNIDNNGEKGGNGQRAMTRKDVVINNKIEELNNTINKSLFNNNNNKNDNNNIVRDTRDVEFNKEFAAIDAMMKDVNRSLVGADSSNAGSSWKNYISFDSTGNDDYAAIISNGVVSNDNDMKKKVENGSNDDYDRKNVKDSKDEKKKDVINSSDNEFNSVSTNKNEVKHPPANQNIVNLLPPKALPSKPSLSTKVTSTSESLSPPQISSSSPKISSSSPQISSSSSSPLSPPISSLNMRQSMNRKLRRQRQQSHIEEMKNNKNKNNDDNDEGICGDDNDDDNSGLGNDTSKSSADKESEVSDRSQNEDHKFFVINNVTDVRTSVSTNNTIFFDSEKHKIKGADDKQNIVNHVTSSQPTNQHGRTAKDSKPSINDNSNHNKINKETLKTSEDHMKILQKFSKFKSLDCSEQTFSETSIRPITNINFPNLSYNTAFSAGGTEGEDLTSGVNNAKINLRPVHKLPF